LITGLAWLLGFQLIGEFVSELFDLPVPGPVIGMLLCFCWLRFRRTGDDAPIVRAAGQMLKHLQLFFVPAGVGVVVYLSLIGHHAVPIVLALVVSWTLGLVVVGWTATLLERAFGKPRDDLPSHGRGAA